MSSKEVIHYFRQQLLERGQAALPGIGSLSFARTPAYVSDNFSKIHPPSYNLEFKDIQDDTILPLSDFIAKILTDLEKNSIMDSIHHASQELQLAILEKGEYHIEGLGRFYNEESGIQFKAIDELQTRKDLGFPVLDVNPLTGRYGAKKSDVLSTTELANTAAITQIKSRKNKSAEFNLKNLWPLIPLLLALVVLIYFLEKQQVSSAILPKVVKINTLDNEVKVTNTQTTTSIDPSKANLNADGTYSGKCIIITGSFKDTANISKMSDILKEKGLTVYTESAGESTRVGFSFSCDSVDLTEYIHKMRKEINTGAWYLQPAITVE